MARGRPPSGPKLVEGMEGSQLARQRLKVILQTVAGELSIPEACAQLGISEPRFHELRAEWMQGAMQLLEPKPVGRPTRQPSPEAARMESLEQQVQELKIDLRAAQIREQLALLMPHVLKARTPAERRRDLDALQSELEKKEKRSSGAKRATPNNCGKSGPH
jgi:hypothetical protein